MAMLTKTCLIPKKIGKDEKDEKSLTITLTLTGTGLETLVMGLVFADELGCEVGGDDGVFFDVFENALKVV